MTGADPEPIAATVAAWFRELATTSTMQIRPTPLERLDGWVDDLDAGVIRHRSRRFFTIEGLTVSIPGAAVPEWDQPIINQPEIGILGLLTRTVDGVQQVLIQAKAEPGNVNGLQLSPTVQATRSNYTRVHGGRPIPYLDRFRGTAPDRVLADVLQSEQGAWFFRKRNRNMIVSVEPHIEVLPGFRWFSIEEIHRLLAVDDLVNMDARTVLSCLPFTQDVATADDGPGFAAATARSRSTVRLDGRRMTGVLSAVTDARTRTEATLRPRRLDRLARWRRRDGRITHDSGAFFDVVGVAVEATGREVSRWSQPMVASKELGCVAMVVTRSTGTLQVLMQLRVEPGYIDVVELAPTVQCTPDNYEHLPAAARPPYLDHVLGADPRDIVFDTVLSEEGGRFLHTRNRYLIVEPAHVETRPGFLWLTLGELALLLRHSYYLNVQARSLVACLNGLFLSEVRHASRAADGPPVAYIPSGRLHGVNDNDNHYHPVGGFSSPRGGPTVGTPPAGAGRILWGEL